LIKTKCAELEIDILALECETDHVHLFLNSVPTHSPAFIMQQLKGATSKIMRDEFPVLSKMPGLWTHSYFVSTAGNVSSETIKRYINEQKTR